MNIPPKSKIIFSLFTIILILTACNLPSPEQVPPPSDVQTAAALTVEALIDPLASATIRVSEQVDTPIPPSATVGPTGTITPTYSIPMLRVLEQTNCRTGPGQDYEVVYTYLQWKELEILGAYPQENYWLVKSESSPGGSCWLWGEYVEISGSYWAVPSLTPPPTATLPPPNAPSVQKWDFFCSTASGTMEVTIQWTDRATDETGYRVIRDDVIVIELPADSSKYTETIHLESGESVTYYIEVYNATGGVKSTPIKLTC